MTRHIRSLVKIMLIIGIAAAISGCDADAPYTEAGNMGLAVEAVEEGLRLSFSDIPPETTRIFINVSDWGGRKTITGAHEIVSRFADIRGNTLDRVKAEGGVTCPFAQSGVKYEIAVCYETSGGVSRGSASGDAAGAENEKWVFAECITGSKDVSRGIHFGGGLELALNEAKTAVTLSAAPISSTDVEYAPAKYQYGVTIKKGEYWSVSVGDKQAGENLTWQFQPLLTDDITASGYLESGDYPAYATAYCNAIYEDVLWVVELAKSGEFTVRF